MVRRVADLGPADLERQIAFIKGSLFSYLARDTAGASAGRDRGGIVDLSGPADLAAVGLVSSADLEAQAEELARELCRRAIRAGDTATWIAPTYLMEAQRYQYLPVGSNLYDGAPGIALFLAALHRASGDPVYRATALAAVRPFCDALAAADEWRFEQLDLGAAVGLGSLTYALVRIGGLLDEPALLEAAAHASARITAERIDTDAKLDVNLGVAGAILGLLSLHEATKEPLALQRAICCGERLLAARRRGHAGPRAWPTVGGRLLTGFSHGAAGIVYALTRLYSATLDPRFLVAAQEGIAYEASVFVQGAGNWPDLQADDQPAFRWSWCHGAPGIALARLGGLPVLDGAEVHHDIAAGVAATEATPLEDVDYLCCGNLGRVEVLWYAGRELGRRDLAESALRRASWILERVRSKGYLLLHPSLPREVYNPGFFQGAAGIGYQLLRLAQPDRLPSVLLWK